MARSVTFNGVTRFRPGGITRVNADALNEIGATASSIIGIIGEADGGEPGSAAELVSFRDPTAVRDFFRSGPLVDAARLAFQSSGDNRVPGGASEVIIFKVNQSTKSTVQIPSETSSLVSTTASGVPTTTVISVAATLIADAYVNRWVDITLAALPGSPVYRRRVTANTTGALTVTPALPQAPAVGNAVVIRASIIDIESTDYGAHTAGITVDVDYIPANSTYQVSVAFEGNTQVSPELGNKLFMKMVHIGGANAVAADTVAASSTNTTINLTTGGLVAAAHANKTAIVNGERVKITTNAAGSLTLEAPGISDDNLESLSVGVSEVRILNVTDAVAEFSNAFGPAPGESTRLTTTITGVAGDNLSLDIPSTWTLRDLLNAINATGLYYAEAVDGINVDTVSARDFDFGTTTSINIQKSPDINGDLGFKQDVMEVVDWINASAVNIVATRSATEGADGGVMFGSSTPPVAGVGYPYQLSGGTRGTSTNSNWQAAFDALLLTYVPHVVALIDENLIEEGNSSTATWASVSQQLLDHVVTARGDAGVERGGYIGYKGTKAQYIAALNSLNDTDIQCVSQYPTVLNAAGSLVEMDPAFFAVMAASMRCGMPEVGEPLTHKFIRCTDLTQDTSWEPTDLTDSADLIRAGALFAEVVPGRGIRWVRDLTTHVKDDNLAFSEGSTRDVVRYVAYNLRVGIEDRFTGVKATPVTIPAIKDAATSLMEQFRTENVIVDSVDPVTRARVKAYQPIQVSSSGDQVKLRVCFFPAVGINFILNDLFLKLPQQSA